MTHIAQTFLLRWLELLLFGTWCQVGGMMMLLAAGFQRQS